MVTPYQVTSVDYDRLINEFGTQKIDFSLIDRFERLTGKPAHPFLKRGIFFSHRSLDKLLTKIEKGESFYLYTGRGPSSESLHLGHLIPLIFTKYLQDVFDVPLIFQVTDDEKFLFKDLTLDQVNHMTRENIKDIIAVGFNPKKTFIFNNLNYIGLMYPNIVKIEKCITMNQIKNTFGFNEQDNIGRFAFPAIQIAPSFSSSFPPILTNKNMNCLIPCAIDQDPFFRLTRGLAPRLKYQKPAVIHSKFFPALQGINTKMSSTDPLSAIFLTDTEDQIRDKIKKHAFSGGKDTLKEHREKGADLEVDIAYQYLKIFHPDDRVLDKITREYGNGQMLTSSVKAEATRLLTEIVIGHQQRRNQVDDNVINGFMEIRFIA